jgi:hypothetical protein
MIDNKEVFLYHNTKTKGDVHGAESECVWGSLSKIPQVSIFHIRSCQKEVDRVAAVISEARKKVNALTDEGMISGIRQCKACAVIYLDERLMRNWRNAKSDERICGYQFTEQVLIEAEKNVIVEAFIIKDMKDLPPKQANILPIGCGINDASCPVVHSSSRQLPEPIIIQSDDSFYKRKASGCRTT